MTFFFSGNVTFSVWLLIVCIFINGRVAEKDWGADFRKLSAGSALVGLTLWLDHMQVNSVSLLNCFQNCLWFLASKFEGVQKYVVIFMVIILVRF